jgi:hypothetical protein
MLLFSLQMGGIKRRHITMIGGALSVRHVEL